MDAVLARRETEEGTESDDLLLQQAETEKRQTDGRNAEEPKGRREQAHGPSVSPERLSPISRTPPAEANGGGPRPLSLIELVPRRSPAAKPTAAPCTTSQARCKEFDNRYVPRPDMPEGTATFEVRAPIERVWAFVSDMRKIGRCVPGVQSVEILDETRARWNLKVKIVPLSQDIEVLTETRDQAPLNHGTYRGQAKDKDDTARF